MTYEPPSLATLRPEPPPWALDAGLPEPEEGECFSVYVSRLGFDVDKLINDLTDQMAPVANVRLGSLLIQAMPEEYEKHLDALVAKHDVASPERDNFARRIFGARYRARRSIRDSA